MEKLYIDRYGNKHQACDNSIFHQQTGVFGAFIINDHILVSWPVHAPDNPELPGGRIEKDEDIIEALLRETIEEADVNIAENIIINQKHIQDVQFFAEDKSEFWDYNQTYYLINLKDDNIFFDGDKQPEDALKSSWIKIDKLKDMEIHYMHKIALRKFGLI